MSALAIADRESGFDFTGLRLVESIPDDRHDVAVLLGEVVAYDLDALHREPLQEGALYVVESQHPVGGMSWETYDRFNREFVARGESRVRIATTRRVIRALRHPRMADHWAHVQPNGFHDGPFPDWAATHNIVGKVVGVFRPHMPVRSGENGHG